VAKRFGEFLRQVAGKEHVYPPMELYAPIDGAAVQTAWQAFAADAQARRLGIYVHVPFCEKKCSFCYCDTVITRDADQIATYVTGLRAELARMADAVSGATVDTIYFGGGTPTVLPLPVLDQLLDDLRTRFSLADDVHLNMEATPYSMTPELAQLLGQHGTDRVTLGIQSNDPGILAAVNRPQSFGQVVTAVEALRAAGVPFINFDLVGGLPEDTTERFADGFGALLDLEPDMVHVYPFSPVGGMARSADQEAIVTRSREMLEDRGFRSLRNDGFGKVDASRNIQVIQKIEEAGSTLGLGIRSRSHVFGRLAYRPTHYRDYLSAAERGEPPPYWGMKLTQRMQIHKFLMDNLKQGLDPAVFSAIFGGDARQVIAHLAPGLTIEETEEGRLTVPRAQQAGHHVNQALLDDRIVDRLYGHWIGQPKGWPEASIAAAKTEAPYQPDLNFARFASTKLTKGIIYPPNAVPKRLAATDVMAAWQDLAGRIRAGTALERVGIYCHVPYCATKCTFCYCYTDELQQESVLASYVDAVERQMRMMAPLVEGLRFNSVYFGGGTPSILRPERLDALLTTLFGHFAMTEDAQFNFEGTPNTLARGRLEVLLKHGVNRLTMGVQSLDRAVLEGIGRMQQGQAGVRKLFFRAREAGIAAINIDLVAGLPGQDFASFEHDLVEVLDWRPDVLHVYPFSNLPDTTTFKDGYRMDDDRAALRSRMVELSHRAIMDAGYLEVQNESYALRHDARNRQDADKIEFASSVMGFGYQARSHVFGAASYGTYPADYQRFMVDPDHDELYYGSRITDHDDAIRFIMSNLREGFSRIHFHDLFGHDVLERFWRPLVWLQRQGIVEITRTSVRSKIDRRADQLALSKLFWDEAVVDALRTQWADEYDPDTDYEAALLAQVDARF
jgi:coproporphyrinogen III oxidase-like Fe-S oxidoreductase